MQYFAHIDPEKERKQTMQEHLLGTAKRAGMFAGAFEAEDMGHFCGLLHDIGKYQATFQRRILGSGERAEHTPAGAQTVLKTYCNLPAAFCISGHHGGLPDGGNRSVAKADDGTFWGKMLRPTEDYSAYHKDIAPVAPTLPPWLGKTPQTLFFYIRMLFSALVDADYLDTEIFMQNGAVQRDGGETLTQLKDKLDAYISGWWNPKEELNQKRCEILRVLLDTGAQARGLFSLTVPTGGGKTTTSMAFALRHAIHNEMARVIYVIPYVSIIEQTQKVFEHIFGAENVVAHYANVEYNAPEDGTGRDTRYLAAENWDAPIILTTAVQFFESLYANRPSRCRKLHHIANSVIIFDEAQMLPVPYLRPCISAIAQLVEHYRCSAVLCTATQPSLDALFQAFLPQYPIRELCPREYAADSIFTRVSFETVGELDEDALAGRLQQERQVLCIVNTKKQALRLFSMLHGKNCFHLSTAMSPEHRSRVLKRIRALLTAKEPCRVVSTSLVEAGVDVDFPTVYRALAGLDSIIQAGGRCNREGKRKAAESKVYIFDTPEPPPQNMRQNIFAAQQAMAQHAIPSMEAVRAYFDFLYYVLKDKAQLDEKDILGEIDRNSMPYQSVAERFRLIENADCTVYVPYDAKGEGLIRQLCAYGPGRGLLRKLGQYAVGTYRQCFHGFVGTGAVEQVSENAGILRDLNLYSEKTGLALEVIEGQLITV